MTVLHLRHRRHGVLVCCCKHQVSPSEMNHVPMEAWLFNHGWRPRSILSRVLWQMLESAPQQVDKSLGTITFHHLIRNLGGILWYTPKKKLVKLKSWCLPYGCFPMKASQQCFMQMPRPQKVTLTKKLRPCEVPHRFRDLIVGRCVLFLSLFWVYNDWAFEVVEGLEWWRNSL